LLRFHVLVVTAAAAAEEEVGVYSIVNGAVLPFTTSVNATAATAAVAAATVIVAITACLASLFIAFCSEPRAAPSS
jgi:hypothetical protein